MVQRLIATRADIPMISGDGFQAVASLHFVTITESCRLALHVLATAGACVVHVARINVVELRTTRLCYCGDDYHKMFATGGSGHE